MKNLSRLWLVAISLLMVAALSHADVYQWQDESGRVVYGDTPPESVDVVEQVDIYECETRACREELQERHRLNRQAADDRATWLDKRAERRASREEQNQSTGQPVIVPRYPVVYPQFIPVPEHGFFPRHPHQRPHRLIGQPVRCPRGVLCTGQRGSSYYRSRESSRYYH